MGYTCKFSIFEGDDNADPKTILSFDNFKEVHLEGVEATHLIRRLF